MDRESRDTFLKSLTIQENLARCGSRQLPIGMGRDFLGCYDLIHDRLELMIAPTATVWRKPSGDERAGRPQTGRSHPEAQLAKPAKRSRWPGELRLLSIMPPSLQVR